MEDGSLIAWKDDGGDLSEILLEWFMKISVKFLSELSTLLKREKFGTLIKSSTRDNKYFRTTPCTHILKFEMPFSYFYPKRKVLADVVSTLPLDKVFVNIFFLKIVNRKIFLQDISKRT